MSLTVKKARKAFIKKCHKNSARSVNASGLDVPFFNGADEPRIELLQKEIEIKSINGRIWGKGASTCSSGLTNEHVLRNRTRLVLGADMKLLKER